MNGVVKMADTSGSRSIFVGNSILLKGNGLKSTKEKLQRQQERDNRIAYLENQKSSLKHMECESTEEIGRKLELFHSYEDQIAAAKEAYNSSQMYHAMDEARERGEKIAEERKKHEPKSAKERSRELAREACGADEGTGMLTELTEEMQELAEELSAEAAEETADGFAEKVAQRSETDENETAADTKELSGEWEAAVRQRRIRQPQPQDAERGPERERTIASVKVYGTGIDYRV